MWDWISRRYEVARMTFAYGPRPWSIWLFGILLALYALFSLVSGMLFLDEQEAILRLQFPQFEWSRDWAIVWVSAQFTIVLIPLFAICLFASSVARLMVTAMALVSAPWIGSYLWTAYNYGQTDWVALVQALLVVFMAGLLYVPSVSLWLRQERVSDAEAFE